MTMTRRGFLSASAAFAATPALRARAWAAPVPRDADIVVIGAGAAGIAAARRVMAANRKVIVVEAAGQIGGRCLTDTTTFDAPFDRGAQWMHNPDTNPMIRLARNAGLACRQGLGTLIAKLGEQVPLSLSTPASRISWSNRDVTVETPAGKIVARAAVITVSSNVLAAGNIRFNPDLPRRHLDAAARLSLGSYDHIALQLPGNPLGLARDEMIIEQSNSTRTALLFANMGSSSLCSIDVAGSFGRDLSAQGEKAMVAFAVEWLTKLFGSDAASAVKKSSATRWNAEPFVLGAMSAAIPGGQPSRRILSEPIGCMFVAGEATHETLWGTVDGAWESGERAAEGALRRIGALREPEPAAPARVPKQRRRTVGAPIN